jgi:phage I-like protein
VPQLRADGLWATDVRWTERAAAMLSSKEYLYFSPAFTTDDAGRPSRLLNVALTNLPATKNMQPLVAASLHPQEQSMKTVMTALSLKESASEAEALSAVAKLSDERKQLLSSTGKETVAEALGVVSAWKMEAAKAEKLSAELDSIKAEKEAAEVAQLLETAAKAKGVAPAKLSEMEAHAKEHGVAFLRACVSVLPDVKAPAIPVAEKPAPAVDGISHAQLSIIKNLGLTPEQFAAHSVKYRQIVNPTEEK